MTNLFMLAYAPGHVLAEESQNVSLDLFGPAPFAAPPPGVARLGRLFDRAPGGAGVVVPSAPLAACFLAVALFNAFSGKSGYRV